MPLDKLTSEAQSVLDNLWTEKLIPFELTAHKVESLGMDEYIIRFHDSRMRSVDVSSKNADSFRNAVRLAVIDRVARMRGPLQKAAGARFLK
jgi:hypothetical protein